MNPRAGATDLLVFEARPFSRLGTPPFTFSIIIVRNRQVNDFMEPLGDDRGLTEKYFDIVRREINNC